MVLVSFRIKPADAGGFLFAAGAGVALALQIYQLYNASRPRQKVAVARTRTEAAATTNSISPYPLDVFPGGRDVKTPYGTIRVFEWGPETGEKVLLMHGIGTPSIALGDMAKAFVDRGCRVMLYDYFGRGYSDAPTDHPYDDRLYTTQLLLVLASSSLSWTGDEAFHIVGYSLGGALAASFAAYFPHVLRSANLICPGGLIRPSHISLKSRILYSDRLFPAWLSQRLIRSRLEPQHHGPSADVPVDSFEEEEGDVDFDQVLLSRDGSKVTVGDVMRWQLRGNPGLVGAYISTIRNAPVYNQHNGLWQLLRAVLEERRQPTNGRPRPRGLPQGRICLVLATRDPVSVKDEWIEDSKAVLGEDGVDIQIVPGGHEIAITKGAEIASCIVKSWEGLES